MKYLKSVVPLIFLFFFTSCASTDVSIYEKAKMRSISSWYIDFAYEKRIDESTEKSTGEKKERQIRTGQLQVSLQLRDDIFFRLKDRYSVPVTQDEAAADGVIRLNPIFVGWFVSVDATLYDKGGMLLARVRVKNGDRNATIKDGYEFAQYAADAIGDVIAHGGGK